MKAFSVQLWDEIESEWSHHILFCEDTAEAINAKFGPGWDVVWTFRFDKNGNNGRFILSQTDRGHLSVITAIEVE